MRELAIARRNFFMIYESKLIKKSRDYDVGHAPNVQNIVPPITAVAPFVVVVEI